MPNVTAPPNIHNYRVSPFSVRLGEKLGISATAMQGLIKGAFLHDVGKIAIRDTILRKPGSLTEEEFEIMKTHVRHGQDIVSGFAWLIYFGISILKIAPPLSPG